MGFDEEWAELRAVAAGRAAGARLAAFRRQLVLVPLDTLGGLWT
ncbi:hypothetical protein [Streptomyces sp. NPDC047976]